MRWQSVRKRCFLFNTNQGRYFRTGYGKDNNSLYDAWLTPQLIFTLHKNKDKVAYLIQSESPNHLDINSPRMTTTQNILKVLAENPLIYPATGAQLRIKAFYKKYHISSGSRNDSAMLLEKETMVKTITDLQSYSYHYLTARFKVIQS